MKVFLFQSFNSSSLEYAPGPGITLLSNSSLNLVALDSEPYMFLLLVKMLSSVGEYAAGPKTSIVELFIIDVFLQGLNY